MTGSLAELQSEVAYDALLEGLPVVLSVIGGRRTRDELAQTGLEPAVLQKHLTRLTRAGLLREQGGRIEPVAEVIEHTRQEGMVTFLSRVVLPVVTRVAGEEDGAIVVQLDLDLAPAEQEKLLRERILPALEKVAQLPDGGPDKVTYTALAIGTSDVPPAGDAGERLIETVRRAARQRATPQESARAILVEGHYVFDDAAVRDAEALIRSCADELAPRAAAPGKRPAYTLALVFCARMTRGSSRKGVR